VSGSCWAGGFLAWLEGPPVLVSAPLFTGR
jgi:hypothetical protein